MTEYNNIVHTPLTAFENSFPNTTTQLHPIIKLSKPTSYLLYPIMSLLSLNILMTNCLLLLMLMMFHHSQVAFYLQ